ncbi:uncharacterized protein PAC_09370 [Phialocephala subalpina]|uniref:Clr5 domain-containing protein n=1 Tax=Phialocephala subalpina TaxID=576137 RepID=A0A1L7X388_9HELO|nr:uncharacterized protein PAC_09370 [Phialocephala subalpina]
MASTNQVHQEQLPSQSSAWNAQTLPTHPLEHSLTLDSTGPLNISFDVHNAAHNDFTSMDPIRTVTNDNPTDQEWELMRSLLHEHYIMRGKTLEEVQVDMMLVYHFKASRRSYTNKFKKWPEFAKNSTKQRGKASTGFGVKKATGRTRRWKKKKGESAFAEGLFRRLSCQIQALPMMASPDINRLQETILDSVRKFVFCLFEGKDCWTSDEFTMTPPAQQQDLSNTWQSISDQAFGVARLVKMSRFSESAEKLKVLFQDLETTMICADPSMLVKFWRICRYFHDVYLVTHDYWLLKQLFSYYGDMTKLKHGSTSPSYAIVRICEALLQIIQKHPNIFMDSLRIGYLKSIHSLMSSVTGHGSHATILAMWSNYLKHWDHDALHQANLQESYEMRLQESDEKFGKNSERSLSILDRFTYAAYYDLHDVSLSKEKATDLLERSKYRLPVDGELHWCLDVQYFGFASKILALVCELEGLNDRVQGCYGEAIKVLERGDFECWTRAEMLRGELGSFLKRCAELNKVRGFEYGLDFVHNA